MSSKYKGYKITKQWLPGSTFKITEDGRIMPRKPRPDEVDYYYAEHTVTGETLVNCSTLEEMKAFIQRIVFIEENGYAPV